MAEESRPLSPHLQIWRWDISMLLSILHRTSGVALSVGTVFLTIWIVALAEGGRIFEVTHGVLTSTFGVICLFLYNAALFYHLCNGVRHMFWDMGYGFEPETTNRSAWAVLVVSLLLTLSTWAIVLGGGS